MKPSETLDPRRIKLCRQQRRLSLKQLAALVDPGAVRKPASATRLIQKWEATGRVSVRYAHALADALEVTLADLRFSDQTDVKADWWIEQVPFYFGEAGSTGVVIPTVFTACNDVGRILENWGRAIAPKAIRLTRIQSRYRISDEADPTRWIDVRAVIVDPAKGLLWTPLEGFAAWMFERHIKDEMFNMANIVFIHDERFPETDEKGLTMVDLTRAGVEPQAAQRRFSSHPMFRAALQEWLHEECPTSNPYRYEYELAAEHFGIRIKRVSENARQSVIATVYEMHPDADGTLIESPWSRREREAFITLLPSWETAPIIWDETDELSPFGFSES